jgi:P27 family predicted phage terminase small subunit
MTAGRPPKPLERRKNLAKGDGRLPGDHRDAKSGKDVAVRPQSVIALPEPPEGLAEHGRQEWDLIWTAGRSWLHPGEDYHWVRQIAQAYDDIDTFREEVNRTSLIVKGYAGQKTANPLLKEIRVLEATIRTCLSKLGFSPTDRAHLGLAEITIQGRLRDLQNRTRANRDDGQRPPAGRNKATAG